VKNPDSSGSSALVVNASEGVELRSVKNPDSSGSSGVRSLVSEDAAKVEVRLDKGPVYGTDDKLELVRPISASIVFVLATACEVAKLVL
jgi:hypothetical protein